MTVPDPCLATCERFLALLDRWNRTHSLTALSPEARFEELVLDSWALVPHLASGARVVDFGSGMGVPAVVLAIARPDLEVVALDKARKKMAFVRQAGMELGLANLKAVAERAEEIPPLAASFGVAKAVGSPRLLSGWWDRHGVAGAPLLALKGEGWEREELPGKDWTLVAHPYTLPTRGDRVVLEMRKRPEA